jgi:hypothetical protein
MVGVLVEKDRRKQDDEKEELRPMLRNDIDRVRAEASFGVSLGLQSATKAPVNIVSIEERTNAQFSAMFAHDIGVERSQVGGLAMLWVLIPKSVEPEVHWAKAPAAADRLKKMMRTDEEEANPSRN